jgi:16S rRNA (cytosine1402-N4)-methyltransferase
VVATVAAQGPDPVRTDAGHLPIMLEVTIEYLAVRPGGRYIDATFGGGGHSRAILEASSPDGELLVLDADPAAIARAHQLQKSFPARMRVAHANFANLAEVAQETGFKPVDGILFDLGLSSYQFDERERGFSLHSNARLDMRLDPTSGGLTAWEIVNEWPSQQIADVLFQFGDEHRSRRIARAIADRRTGPPIETNQELAELVQAALGGRKGARVHPATKTFQAIRIAVNAELDALRTGLASARDLLLPGGRIAVIAFHSLEDRIVKQFFQTESRDCICPPHLPVCNCDHKSTLKVITRRPIVPTDEEQRSNPRSRSARLRVAERI